jgi:hypothetical protein
MQITLFLALLKYQTFFNIILGFFPILQKVISKESGFDLSFSMFLQKKKFFMAILSTFSMRIFFFFFSKPFQFPVPFAGDPPRFWQKWHFQL